MATSVASISSNGQQFRVLGGTDTVRRGASNRLVVVLHGALASSMQLVFVRHAIEETLPDADLLIPDYHAGPFSDEQPEEVAEELCRAIQCAVDFTRGSETPYEEIILIGYSIGSPLVLRSYLDGRDKWQSPVQRIILIAGVNWGWLIWPKAPTALRFLKGLLRVIFLSAARSGRAGMLRALYRGKPFVGRLRAEWSTLIASHPESLPLIVQIVGADDEWVTSEDELTLIDAPSFRQLSIPLTGHIDILLMPDTPLGRPRREKLIEALTMTREETVAD